VTEPATPASTYEVSTDPARLDVALIHRWLSQESHWARGIPRDTVERALANALNFAAFDRNGRQVGFARIVTDKATFAWLADVFVIDEHRGKGLSRLLMQAIVDPPDLQGLRRWLLATRDAHGLYEKFGFTAPPPGRLMERLDPDIYTRET
jgi:GNAT superfamily N-acetyltransferase